MLAGPHDVPAASTSSTTASSSAGEDNGDGDPDDNDANKRRKLMASAAARGKVVCTVASPPLAPTSKAAPILIEDGAGKAGMPFPPVNPNDGWGGWDENWEDLPWDIMGDFPDDRATTNRTQGKRTSP